jgi:hypothetical protein
MEGLLSYPPGKTKKEKKRRRKKKGVKKKMFEGLLLMSLGIGLVVLCALLGLIFGAVSFAQLSNTCAETSQPVILEEQITTFSSSEPISSCNVHVALDENTLISASAVLFVDSTNVTKPAFAVSFSPFHQKELKLEVTRLHPENQLTLSGFTLSGSEALTASCVSRGKVHVVL